jgi:hypothetical protein
MASTRTKPVKRLPMKRERLQAFCLIDVGLGITIERICFGGSMQEPLDRKLQRRVFDRGAASAADRHRKYGETDFGDPTANDILNGVNRRGAEIVKLPVWVVDRIHSAIDKKILSPETRVSLGHKVEREALLAMLEEQGDRTEPIEEMGERHLAACVTALRRLASESKDGIVEINPGFEVNGKRMLEILDSKHASNLDVVFAMQTPREYQEFLKERDA